LHWLILHRLVHGFSGVTGNFTGTGIAQIVDRIACETFHSVSDLLDLRWLGPSGQRPYPKGRPAAVLGLCHDFMLLGLIAQEQRGCPGFVQMLVLQLILSTSRVP
jgi:hypothetical protein